MRHGFEWWVEQQEANPELFDAFLSYMNWHDAEVKRLSKQR